MPRLFEVTDEYLMLQQALDECEDEVSAEHIKSAITVTMENAGQVIGRLIEVQKNYEAEEAMFKAAEDNFSTKKDKAKKKAASIKAFISEQLVTLGFGGGTGNQLKAGLYTTFMQYGKSSLIVLPDAIVPDLYYTQPETIIPPKKLDEELLKGAIASGLVTIEGVTIRKNQSIRIK